MCGGLSARHSGIRDGRADAEWRGAPLPQPTYPLENESRIGKSKGHVRSPRKHGADHKGAAADFAGRYLGSVRGGLDSCQNAAWTFQTHWGGAYTGVFWHAVDPSVQHWSAVLARTACRQQGGAGWSRATRARRAQFCQA